MRLFFKSRSVSDKIIDGSSNTHWCETLCLSQKAIIAQFTAATK